MNPDACPFSIVQHNVIFIVSPDQVSKVSNLFYFVHKVVVWKEVFKFRKPIFLLCDHYPYPLYLVYTDHCQNIFSTEGSIVISYSNCPNCLAFTACHFCCFLQFSPDLKARTSQRQTIHIYYSGGQVHGQAKYPWKQ